MYRCNATTFVWLAMLSRFCVFGKGVCPAAARRTAVFSSLLMLSITFKQAAEQPAMYRCSATPCFMACDAKPILCFGKGGALQ